MANPTTQQQYQPLHLRPNSPHSHNNNNTTLLHKTIVEADLEAMDKASTTKQTEAHTISSSNSTSIAARQSSKTTLGAELQCTKSIQISWQWKLLSHSRTWPPPDHHWNRICGTPGPNHNWTVTHYNAMGDTAKAGHKTIILVAPSSRYLWDALPNAPRPTIIKKAAMADNMTCDGQGRMILQISHLLGQKMQSLHLLQKPIRFSTREHS